MDSLPALYAESILTSRQTGDPLTGIRRKHLSQRALIAVSHRGDTFCFFWCSGSKATFHTSLPKKSSSLRISLSAGSMRVLLSLTTFARCRCPLHEQHLDYFLLSYEPCADLSSHFFPPGFFCQIFAIDTLISAVHTPKYTVKPKSIHICSPFRYTENKISIKT